MKYFIKRDLSEYGPYALADLQKYVQTGQILQTDLCRSEGMADWVPVSQVVGNVEVPPPVPAGQAYAPTAAYDARPSPPNMHWGVVLLISIFTCGFFGTIWLLVQAVFVKKVDENSRALMWNILSLVGYWAMPVASAVMTGGDETGSPAAASLTLLGYAIGLGFYIAAVFSMKSSFEEHYLNQFGYSRGLSGVVVFFFAPYYFQYHVNDTEKQRAQALGAHA